MGHTDADLVVATRSGDRDAFGELVRRYRDAVYGVSYHRLGDFAASEDLTQDAFVQAYVRLGELRDPARFAPWLFAVARNLCNQHLRRRRETPGLDADDLSTDGLESHAAERDLVHRALLALPPGNALALTLFYVDGYSYAEIATFLDVPTSTLKGRIERGRSRLRGEMTAMLRDHLDEHKPGDDLPELVIERISAAEVWALPPERRRAHLVGGPLLIDGHLAEMRFLSDVGSTDLESQASIWTVGDQPLCVFQVAGNTNRYYVFGKGRVDPDGPVVENQVIETSVRVTPAGDQALATEPWRPEKVSGAAVWALPPDQRDVWLRDLHNRTGGLIMLDGGLAHYCLANGGKGCGTCSGGHEVYLWNRGEHNLNVFQATRPSVRYYVFGEAEVVPPGLRVTNGVVTMAAVLEGPIRDGQEEREQAEALSAFSSEELWRLDPRAQSDLLCQVDGVALIDGQICTVKLTGGSGTNLVAKTRISTVGDESLAVYRFVREDARYCIFGEAELPQVDRRVANQVLETEVAVTELSEDQVARGPGHLTELRSADICALSGPERNALLEGLPPGVPVMLDGGLAYLSLTGGPPGSSCGTPGNEVRFTNVGQANLHILRWRWPRARYFIFGEAEAAPPGLQVKDAVLVLEGRAQSSSKPESDV